MRNVRSLISQELLTCVRGPGQYIGLETNAHCGDVDAAEVSVVLAFPDAYEIGISHFGSQVLYNLLNALEGVACDRTYCPWGDAEEIMRKASVPLFAWESRCAVADFDMVGFSLAHEMCVTNVLTMLDLAGIALRSADRGEEAPLIIAGDALADSPEPMADFIDIFVAGDGEAPLRALVELVAAMKPAHAPREEMILEAARTIAGVYAPRFYEPLAQPGSAPAAVRPLRDDVPAVIEHVHVASLSDYPAVTRPLVPLYRAVQERVVIEIMRGCPNACRFCQAGAVRKPVRIRSVDEIIDIASAAIDATGFREISLLSLSTSDYPHIDKLIERLSAKFTPQRVSVSLPSLRVGSQLRYLPRLTSKVRKGGLTIAAETGSERLRRAIRKDITEQDMVTGVLSAYEAGWRNVKVYFMAGLPGEREEDIDAIFKLCKRLSEIRRQVDGRPGAISAAVSWFVPKPHTSMQWCAMRDTNYYF
ncbi:MAG: TIGR03960 family B12-binding radical SAM protein, partial [Planctomycetes bacterium]|nr:TIGR03960 family B12-binding radical SAM protein [Planctomycetota bacterium]